ncbi:hypothetical protein [Mesorhizobium sp.]|uniref:hypothetical protein n=1 Tax=Mesorhizobium sp. TaxID=1871066 RepID=UPI000FE3FF64|nr:hypothetical protein [Mesorhizobium sp.]RWN58927.1 MAG: hypothetical protein EOR98_00490 [Mesorhizobium sp.]RWN74754.1 MAG: hypothetical protein EOS01_23625 [Mesorhizobium sp.]RWN80436.1 MAG: hypothetical protein EOS02_00490 [Mesorhizobium sp.]RWN81845.1 MAG: hypothetical protein EOS04_32790 [Mesorhizobium sp.]RWO10138.1 MAG: hypothetical protein EOS15_25840 [Mesorhizobium sp.]
MLIHRLATLTGLAVVTLFLAAPAKALTMAECSTKYNAAKDAGTLGGQNWNQFRKAECGTVAAATDATPAKPDSTSAATTDAAAAATTKAAATANAGNGLSRAECGAKYRAAKTANTLNGMKWNDFRMSQCGASGSDDTIPAADQASLTSQPEKPTVTAPQGVTFPKAISTKYSSETPSKARMHTCRDQYHANKDAGTLGGLKWIQNGGGFYSLCNAALKS